MPEPSMALTELSVKLAADGGTSLYLMEQINSHAYIVFARDGILLLALVTSIKGMSILHT
jgi:hypothetical protein